jgi:hypothetical protein
MVTVKQSSVRFRTEDLAVLEEVQRRMGLMSLSDAMRFVIHQYAKAEGITLSKPAPRRKPKRK